jgi:cullin-5
VNDKPQIVFEEQWPKMQPSIVKLLRQESINRSEWQDLFYSIHQVCSWDEKAAAKIYKALQENILDFIRQAQQVQQSNTFGFYSQVGAKVLDGGLVVLLVVLYLCILVGFQRVLSHSEDQALLKAYINEWGKFFDQCGYLPKPFSQVEITLNNQSANNAVNNKKHKNDDSDVRKVSAFWDRFERTISEGLVV